MVIESGQRAGVLIMVVGHISHDQYWRMRDTLGVSLQNKATQFSVDPSKDEKCCLLCLALEAHLVHSCFEPQGQCCVPIRGELLQADFLCCATICDIVFQVKQVHSQPFSFPSEIILVL